MMTKCLRNLHKRQFPTRFLPSYVSPCFTSSFPFLRAFPMFPIVFLPVSYFRSYPKHPPFYSFTSFSSVSVITFINKPNSSRYLMIFMISFKSLFEKINVVVPDPKIFF